MLFRSRGIHAAPAARARGRLLFVERQRAGVDDDPAGRRVQRADDRGDGGDKDLAPRTASHDVDLAAPGADRLDRAIGQQAPDDQAAAFAGIGRFRRVDDLAAGLLSLVLLTVVGLLSPHRGLRKLRLPGILLALNGVAWLILNKVVISLAVAKSQAGYTHDLAVALASESFSRILTVGGASIAFGALAFGLSYRSTPTGPTDEEPPARQEANAEESSEPHPESPE